MSKYRIFELDEFRKTISRLTPSEVQLIRSKLEDYAYPLLRQEPHFGKNIKRLRDYDPATWRYRIGRYRVFYRVDEEEKIVLISSVDRRKDAYR